MAVFKFKLRSLHRLKAQIEDQAKNKFGIAIAKLNAELAVLNRIRGAIAAAMDEFRTLSGKRFTAGRIKEFNYFISTMRDKEAAQQTVVEEAMVRVNRAREELIVASRQREMFDKLRDKAFARYMEEVRRAEQRAVDELVSYRGSLQSG
ncbi:MAG: flagellar export protein FliJ [Oscillospiraceae bacterium]|nr:flagellar export protein FliJ [Oscillospiraceae bacterium]